VSYDDGGVACTADALVIRRYYFPFGNKSIRYVKIDQAQRVPLTFMSGRWRIWGSGDFVHWFNLDSGRPDKNEAFIINVRGSVFKPVITPRDPDSVAAELTSHGVNVTAG
jgi:hypothetical protein